MSKVILVHLAKSPTNTDDRAIEGAAQAAVSSSRRPRLIAGQRLGNLGALPQPVYLSTLTVSAGGNGFNWLEPPSNVRGIPRGGTGWLCRCPPMASAKLESTRRFFRRRTVRLVCRRNAIAMLMRTLEVADFDDAASEIVLLVHWLDGATARCGYLSDGGQR
ncbi:hypothetical protein ACVWXN_007032 [Bradyrhizobium sp. i1.4.4]